MTRNRIQPYFPTNDADAIRCSGNYGLEAAELEREIHAAIKAAGTREVTWNERGRWSASLSATMVQLWDRIEDLSEKLTDEAGSVRALQIQALGYLSELHNKLEGAFASFATQKTTD